MDEEQRMYDAIHKGLKEGREEGKAEGIKQGREEGKAEMIKQLFSIKMDKANSKSCKHD